MQANDEVDWRPGQTIALKRDDDEESGPRWTYDNGTFYATLKHREGVFSAYVAIDHPEDELLTGLTLYEQEGTGSGESPGEALDAAHKKALSVQALNLSRVQKHLEWQIEQPEVDRAALEALIDKLSSDRALRVAVLLEKFAGRPSGLGPEKLRLGREPVK